MLSLTFKEPQVGPAGIPIEIRLQGSDLAELKAASRELKQESAFRRRAGGSRTECPRRRCRRAT